MYKKILVATDGSTLSKKAVTHAISLAQLSGAELVALKVVPRYPQSYFEGGMVLPASDVGRIEKQWMEHSQTIVDAVAKSGTAKGVTVKAITSKSDLVSDAIIAAAKKAQMRFDCDGLARPQWRQALVTRQRNSAGADALHRSSFGAALS
jgi:nucleotide-binding universal stress UspA family protein